jgi:alpha-N-arabinofuranosidase
MHLWNRLRRAAAAVLAPCAWTLAGSAASPVPVAVDVRQQGHDINPFIYGQFIEHLGRCIYGGIWAEMLEDRKFYFPITPDYDPYVQTRDMAAQPRVPVVGRSPWQIAGLPESVVMVRENSFVGDHTPLIRAGSAIWQNDLGLVRGKEYTGYLWLRAADQGGRVVVTLRGAAGDATIEPGGTEYKQYPLRFTAEETTEHGSLQIRVEGADCLVGTASLMPADNCQGLRADTLELLRELRAPMYRWPGGNFVSGYDWRDGIGDRDRRPPQKNPAWTGVEHNDFGLDEFLAFCRELQAEPLIAVNTGLGDANSAAQEVEYCNGSTETVSGRWRAANGHPEPYGVKWWCVGNEMFGPWQLGFMQLRHYTLKHNQVAAAMRAADPTIRLVGVGDLGRVNRRHDPDEKRGWSRGMLSECADAMDAISEHFYCGAKDDLAEHVRQIPDRIREKAEGHRRLRAELPTLQGKDIDIAMDEWNYWHRPYEYGELGCIYRLRDALGIAAGLHEFFRQSDIIEMAHYAQTVNVIGCIKTTRTEAAFATTGLPLLLYRRHFGVTPVRVTGGGSLDVMAALTADRRRLTVGIVNPTMEVWQVDLQLTGASITGSGQRWQITGEGPMAFNEPGQEPQVTIEETPVTDIAGQLDVPACSMTLYSLELGD